MPDNWSMANDVRVNLFEIVALVDTAREYPRITLFQ